MELHKAAKPIDTVRLILREDNQVQLKVLIPQSIGNKLREYNNQKISIIERKSKAAIEVNDSPYPNHPNHVWCLFRGTIVAIANAVDVVMRMTIDSQPRTTSECSVMLLLPSLLVGKVIGFRGMCVWRMRTETRAQLICLGRPQARDANDNAQKAEDFGFPDDEKVVLFKGDLDSCRKAIQFVLKRAARVQLSWLHRMSDRRRLEAERDGNVVDADRPRNFGRLPRDRSPRTGTLRTLRDDEFVAHVRLRRREEVARSSRRAVDLDSDDDDVQCLEKPDTKALNTSVKKRRASKESQVVDEAALLRLIDDVRQEEFAGATQAETHPNGGASSPKLMSQEDAPIVLDDDDEEADDDIILMGAEPVAASANSVPATNAGGTPLTNAGGTTPSRKLDWRDEIDNLAASNSRMSSERLIDPDDLTCDSLNVSWSTSDYLFTPFDQVSARHSTK